MQLDTTRRLEASEAGEAGEAGEARAQPIVQIEYLASYGGGMGVVDVSCANGCRCPPTSFDAHSPAIRSSRHVLRCPPVTEAA